MGLNNFATVFAVILTLLSLFIYLVPIMIFKLKDLRQELLLPEYKALICSAYYKVAYWTSVLAIAIYIAALMGKTK